MADLTRLGPPSPSQPQLLAAVVHTAPASASDSLTVTVTSFDRDLVYEIERWSTHGSLPAVGDDALVAIGDDGELWMISFVPSAPAPGPGEGLPTGVIVAWPAEEIPAGFLLANGQATPVDNEVLLGLYGANLPDLRDLTLFGASETKDLGDEGGEAEVELDTSEIPSHSHGDGTLAAAAVGSHSHGDGTLSAALAGSHSHGFSGNTAANTQVTGSGGSNRVTGLVDGHGGDQDRETTATGNHTHDVSGSTGDAGGHGHDVTGATANAGGGEAHNNIPPFMAVHWIVKT